MGIFDKLFNKNTKENKEDQERSKKRIINLIKPSEEWLELYEEKKKFLTSPRNYWDIFEKVSQTQYSNKDGISLHILRFGTVKVTSGHIIVCDPINWLDWNTPGYLQEIALGEYPLETIVGYRGPDDYDNIITRLRISNERPVAYYEPMVGLEELENINEKWMFGYPSDTNTATIMDIDAKMEFLRESEEKDQNFPHSTVGLYNIDGTDYDLVFFSMPVDEIRAFPVYFGYLENGEVGEVVLPYLELDI